MLAKSCGSAETGTGTRSESEGNRAGTFESDLSMVSIVDVAQQNEPYWKNPGE
jgi:hypothetical protein